MILRVLGLPPVDAPEGWSYSIDQDELPDGSIDYLWTAYAHGILDRYLLLDGYYDEGQSVKFNEEVNRLEAAIWIARAYHLRLYLLEPPIVQTLNITNEANNSPGNNDSDNQDPWIWVLVGGGVILAGMGSLFFVLKRRTLKKSA